MADIIRLNASNTGIYNINLNGTLFLLRTYWNQYANRWFMDFQDVNNNPIAMGLAIVHGVNLFESRPKLSVEIGEIRPIDLSGEDCQDREALGDTTVMVYFLPGEFEALFPNQGSIETRPFNYDFDSFFTPV